MAIVETDGIVTKETKYGDTSRILTVISRKLGKISVLAGNARRSKSGLLTATAMLSHSNFTLFKSGSSSLYKLNEGELVTSFSSLRESLEGMAFASYFCDITNTVVQENAPDVSQMELLLRSLYMLTKAEKPIDYEKIKAVFEFRTLTLIGQMPDLSQCGGCGCTDGLCYISPQNGAVYCANCLPEMCGAMQINDSLLAAIAYISLAEDKKIFSFNMSDASIRYLSEIGERCTETMLERSFKTLDYLRKVMV